MIMSNWLSYLKGSERLKYVTESQLSDFEIFEVVLHRDGPRLEAKLSFNNDLIFIPEKWKDNNALIIHVGFYGISNISLCGWDVKNVSKLHIEKDDDKLSASFEYDGGKIEISFISFQLIDFQAYQME